MSGHTQISSQGGELGFSSKILMPHLIAEPINEDVNEYLNAELK